MDAYKKFIKISKHKELKDTREQAQRELATITKDFNDNIENLNNECEQPFQNKQFKEAYYTCLEASKSIPPSHNHHVHSIMDKSKEQLKIQMKPLYEEATINESMGNISTATDYWGKIIQQDVDSGIYYQKAKIKLKNY